jgi:hypothetical protein
VLSFSVPLNGFGFRDCERGGSGGPGPDQPGPSDVIVAASFHTLRADQHRVVFREGGFVEGSNFYPAPGCPPPPPGFSIEDAPAYSETPVAGGGCVFRAADAPVEVTPLSPDQATALLCRPSPRRFAVCEPTSSEPPSGLTPICLAPGVMAAVVPGTCPGLLAFPLKGCESDPFCTAGGWDHSAAPPPWWPCH